MISDYSNTTGDYQHSSPIWIRCPWRENTISLYRYVSPYGTVAISKWQPCLLLLSIIEWRLFPPVVLKSQLRHFLLWNCLSCIFH